MRKNLLSLILCITMILSCFSILSVYANNDYMLHNDNFDDGTSVSGWWRVTAQMDDSNSAPTYTISDGILSFTRDSAGWACPAVRFNPELNIADNDIIHIETRIKVGDTVAPIPNKERYFLATYSNKDAAAATVGIHDNGYLKYGGDDSEACITDYQMHSGTWYTIIIKLKNHNQMAVSVVDENGNSYNGEFKPTRYYANINSIKTIKLPNTAPADNERSLYVDYVKVYDPTMLPYVSAFGEFGELEGATVDYNTLDVALQFTNAVTLDDLSGISVTNDAVINVTNLSDDGLMASLNISKLKPYTSYQLTVPSMGENAETIFNFKTKDDENYYARAEFNGDDDKTAWYKRSSNWTESLVSGSGCSISNGNLVCDKNTMPWNGFNLNFSDGLDFSGKENIVWETRMMLNRSDGASISNFRLLSMYNDQNGYATIGIKNGNIYYGGAIDQSAAAGTTTEYTLKNGVWYNYKFNFNFVNGTYKVTISDDEGIVCDFPEINFVWDSKPTKIKNFLFPIISSNTSAVQCYIDYTRIYEKKTLANPTVFGDFGDLEGATVDYGEIEAGIMFAEAVTLGDLANISATNGAIISVTNLSDDGLMASIKISGLKPYTNYQLTVPTIGENPETIFNFKTKDDEKFYVRAEFNGDDDKTAWYKRSSNWGESLVSGSGCSVSNGNLVCDKDTMPWNGFNLNFSDGLDFSGKANIVWETRMMLKKSDGNSISNLRLLSMYNDQNGYATMGIKDGYIYYGGAIDQSAAAGTTTEYTLDNGVWYNYKINFNFVNGTYKVTISDDEGMVCDLPEINFVWDSKPTKINNFLFPIIPSNTTAIQCYIDYTRIWDEGLSVKENIYSKPVFDQDVIVNGQKITASTSIVSYTKEPIVLIIALYANNEQFTGMNCLSTETSGEGIEEIIDIGIVPQSGDIKAKAFLWKSLGEMIPIEMAILGE